MLHFCGCCKIQLGTLAAQSLATQYDLVLPTRGVDIYVEGHESVGKH